MASTEARPIPEPPVTNTTLPSTGTSEDRTWLPRRSTVHRATHSPPAGRLARNLETSDTCHSQSLTVTDFVGGGGTMLT
jgi:hypothetical protein